MKIVFTFTELKEPFDFSKTYSPGFYKDDNDTFIVWNDAEKEEKNTTKMISEDFALEMLRIVTKNKQNG